MIKAIIFDMGGVLVDNPAPGMMAYYSKHLGVNEEMFRNTFPRYEKEWQTGKITEDTFWENMARDLGVDKPATASLWLDGFLSRYKEKDAVIALIKDLKRRAYKAAILSNTEVPIVNHIKAIFIDDKLENIQTAQGMGIHGILFKSPEQITLKLQQTGIFL